MESSASYKDYSRRLSSLGCIFIMIQERNTCKCYNVKSYKLCNSTMIQREWSESFVKLACFKTWSFAQGVCIEIQTSQWVELANFTHLHNKNIKARTFRDYWLCLANFGQILRRFICRIVILVRQISLKVMETFWWPNKIFIQKFTTEWNFKSELRA